jgi:NAD(P)-dependent dehydrogenase (short-subunit alcohol dehydrogenase family)
MQRYLIMGLGGIGLTLAKQLAASGHEVIIAGRTKPALAGKFHSLDIEQEESFSSLFDKTREATFDVIINTIGVLHDDGNGPEKSILQLNPEWFMHSMQVNCMSTLLALKHLSKWMPRQHELKFIAFSARVGSIDDNRLGGWISYRASKAALNMIIKTVSLEWKFKFPKATLVGYHPGTVDTNLSKPFQANHSTLFTKEQAVNYLLEFSQTLHPDMSGNIYDWKKERIPF